jgi:cation:H+ antiporter
MGTYGGSRQWGVLIVVVLLGLPSIGLLFSGLQLHPMVAAAVYGAGILAGAFLFSWAAEVAELDISASLAIAILALLTVLPEYAIEAVLAWDAGSSFDTATRAVTDETERVAANVNGANRMIVGVGWPVVILVSWAVHRRVLDLRGHIGPEMTFLTIAVAVTFPLFFIMQIHFFIAAALIALYVAYLWVSSRREGGDTELAGVAAVVGHLPVAWRRTTVILLFLYAAGVIGVAADPFVGGLVETGIQLGVDEFVLIQWLAPLASETPEVVVAVLFATRSNPAAGLTVLIASGVNKFTLLVGSMVGIFSLSAGGLLSFPLNDRQAAEFLLTTAFSLFGLLLIARRTVDWKTGALLLTTFVAHLFFPQAQHRLWFAYGFFGLSVITVALDWRRLKYLVKEDQPNTDAQSS